MLNYEQAINLFKVLYMLGTAASGAEGIVDPGIKVSDLVI